MNESNSFTERVLADVKRVCEDLERGPSADEYDEHGEFALATVRAHFGFREAVEQAGYNPVGSQGSGSSGQFVTREECREIREQAAQGLTFTQIAEEQDRTLQSISHHATGDCQHHGVEVEPVEPRRQPRVDSE